VRSIARPCPGTTARQTAEAIGFSDQIGVVSARGGLRVA